MRKNIIKILVFFLNITLISTGVFYLKEKDDKKKEEKRTQEEAGKKEIASFNIEKTQEILESVKNMQEEYISSNPGEIVVQSEKTIQKTVPAVTKVIVSEKKVPVSSSSKES